MRSTGQDTFRMYRFMTRPGTSDRLPKFGGKGLPPGAMLNNCFLPSRSSPRDVLCWKWPFCTRFHSCEVGWQFSSDLSGSSLPMLLHWWGQVASAQVLVDLEGCTIKHLRFERFFHPSGLGQGPGNYCHQEIGGTAERRVLSGSRICKQS